MMNPDKHAIDAIKLGDRNRFAELVERHQRMVYGITWSYLGDADLCEDAAQETFIRAYRYLGALREGEKFHGWLARIARNVSATLLRRRRSELQGKARWALFQSGTEAGTEAPSPAAAEDDEISPETLSNAIAQLPAVHRECLVLFYLEGKGVREAAEALGISETALKTRLHRARRALRGQLETKIERGLEGLGPRKNFTAAVMLLLPAKPLGWAGLGGGASLLGKSWGGLAKLLPSLAFTFWMALCQIAPFWLVMRWFDRLEAANFTEASENRFRRSLLRRNTTMVIVMAGGAMLAAVLLFFHLGVERYFQLLTLFCAWGVYNALRMLRLNRSDFVKGQVLANGTFFITSFAIGFLDAPYYVFMLGLGLLNLALIRTNRAMPRRQDYNLFLRQAGGMLGQPEEEPEFDQPLTEPELSAFARFLGGEWLARDYTLKCGALTLKLPPVRGTLANMLAGVGGGNVSVAEIDAAGNCRARLNKTDEEAIVAAGFLVMERCALEAGVCRAVRGALALFRRGELEQARAILSPQPDEAIFKGDPGQSRSYRIQRRYILVVSIVMLLLTGVLMVEHATSNRDSFGFLQGWTPRPVTQKQARKAVGKWLRNEAPNSDSQLTNLWMSPAHPSLGVIGEENVAAYKERVKRELGNVGSVVDVTGRIVNKLLNPYMLYQALAAPILSTEELSALGFDKRQMRSILTYLRPELKRSLFSLNVGRSMLYRVSGLSLESNWIDIQSFARRLWILKEMGCLDLVDHEALGQAIAERQITKDTRDFKGFAPLDPARTAGLFHFGQRNLGETWAALWALETLGQLGRIDREACIACILRFYKGKGVFREETQTMSQHDENLGILVTGAGNAEDAFYAMESLARLKALDRIKDFQKWEFHPVTSNVTAPKANGGSSTRPGFVTFEALRAWAFQERLEQLRAGRP